MTTCTTNELMPIEHIDDWDKRVARQDAFWDCAILDRPVVIMTYGKSHPDYLAPPPKEYCCDRERWLDAEQIAKQKLHGVMNTAYCGDALPGAWPNLGPEVFSAYFGTEMEYGPNTSWSIPNLKDWNEVDQIKFSTDNDYWKKTIEMTDIMLELGNGKFYTGFTDIHPGGDGIAAFRDPMNLNIDMIEHPEEVKKLREYVDETFEFVFDYFGDKFAAAQGAFTTWPGIVSSRRWHVPSNDFSCMISKPMFDDIFLPGIARECKHAEASIYHLDGPGALKHLDSLLEIKELNAIQWVFGAGNGGPLDWLDVYKRCQAAGKGIQLGVNLSELDTIMDKLRPEGVWLRVAGVKDQDTADEVIRRISKWL